jgi:hypothetical protein
MTGSLGRDDSRTDGDALDRAIDDALRAELRGGPGDLRAKVLARLEEPADERTSWWRSTLLRPALLPAAGAVLIVVGVALSWWQVDDQLGRIGSGRYLADARLASRSPASGTVARGGSSAAEVRIPAGAPATSASPAASRGAQAASRGPRGGTVGVDRIFAASLLEMDALSRPKGIAAAGAVAADEDETESFLPGAIGGNLGDPIRPIPRPRPIVIPPIGAAPIAALPIVDAPPVSTLATPVSTLSTDSSSRDQTGPGKSGGVRP